MSSGFVACLAIAMNGSAIIFSDTVHVKVVDQHVMEDAAAGTQVLHGGQWVVAAAGLHHLADSVSP